MCLLADILLYKQTHTHTHPSPCYNICLCVCVSMRRESKYVIEQVLKTTIGGEESRRHKNTLIKIFDQRGVPVNIRERSIPRALAVCACPWHPGSQPG